MRKELGERYKHFEDLPSYIRRNLISLLGPDNVEKFVTEPIPELRGKTIVKILNEEGEIGEKRVFTFIQDLLSMYGGKDY